MQETQQKGVRSLGWRDPWRRAWWPTPVFLPGESPWTEEPGRLQSIGSQRVRHDRSDFSQSFHSLSRVWLFATPWTTAGQASLSITNSWSLLTLMSIESVMPFNHLILCHPLLLLPSIFPSIRVFSSESALRIKWPKYWSFSFNISPSNEHSRLISFSMDWLNLLTVQGSLKSLLQHHSLKAPILPRSAFFYLAHTIFNSCIKSHKILWP